MRFLNLLRVHHPPFVVGYGSLYRSPPRQDVEGTVEGVVDIHALTITKPVLRGLQERIDWFPNICAVYLATWIMVTHSLIMIGMNVDPDGTL